MPSQKEYAYAIKGNRLILVERDFTGVQNGQTLAAPSVDLPRGYGQWRSPQESVTGGLEIEYTISPGATIKDESSEIPVPDYLAKALVYYIKAKLTEGEKDFKTREYYMKQFYKMLEKHSNAKIYGARRISPGNHRIG